LGDIVNSQPIIVGSPFSNYDYLFGDTSYATYKAQNVNRRHLAMVGSNDGMLHAVNMGFPISLKDGFNGYTEPQSGAMGREMWAFIPQSLLPHLQWLPLMDYAHSYYMDMTPTVVEVKDGSTWKTLVISSLRYGGRTIETKANPPSYSYSEVFALDITNPDKEPTLLWRFSHPQMGLVVSKPTVVRNTSNGDNWYVLIGSGPTYDEYDPMTGQSKPLPEKGRMAYQGHSNQSAKVFVFNVMSGPGTGNSAVTVLDTHLPKSFISQFQVLNAFPSSLSGSGDSVAWSNSLAYFSINQSAPDTELLCLADTSQTNNFLNSNNPYDLCSAFPTKFKNYGYLDKGSVWRLNMTTNTGEPLPLSAWQNNFKMFFNADRAISAAVNTTFDVNGNLWVIFGSGRYWSGEDSRLCEGAGDTRECRLNHINYIYGIKEPFDSDGNFAFSSKPVDEKKLLDVSNVVVYPNSSIRATKPDGSYDIFTDGANQIYAYDQLASLIASSEYAGYRRALKTDLENYIDSDEADDPSLDEGVDWWQGLSFEMIVHQVAVAPFGDFGSVYGFSTFMPQSVSCGSAGISTAMLLDTFTGLPKPDFSQMEFVTINKFQDFHAPTNSDGQKAVSDHVYKVSGLSAATVFVMTGTNAQKRGQFETVNSDGTVTVIKLPEDKMPRGGVHSWREVLDYSTIGVE
jgi:type IV pilus assembly protein PilY1